MRKLTYDKTVLTKQFLDTRYKAGFTRAELARELNVTPYTIRRAELDFGVSIPDRIGRKKFTDVSDKYKASHAEQFQKFLDLHNQGMSYSQIAATCGCSQAQVGKLFTVFGYSFDTVYKTKAAHDAIRGKKRSDTDLCRRAIGKQLKHPKLTRWESLFYDFLVSNGLPFVCSKAVGKYNLDFAVGTSIAVELFGGAFHSTGRAADRLHERMKFLIDNGWNVYIIWCLSNESSIFPGCLDDFISFYETVGGNESPVGQYRVIWSDGDFVSAGSLETNYLTAVKPARFRHNALAKYRTARN